MTVYRGVVGLSALSGGAEIAIPAGRMAGIHDGTIELRRIPFHRHARRYGESPLAHVARHEVGLDMSRNPGDRGGRARAAHGRLHRRQGSLIDANGNRVRLEEYIVRPQPNEFKLVVLNERASGLDYFFYAGTFNQNLPADLSVALRDLGGTYGTTAPTYYLDLLSNGPVQHAGILILDSAAGGPSRQYPAH